MNSKRLIVALIALIANTFIYYHGIQNNAQLMDLGIGLALLNAPIYAYITAETVRPSGIVQETHKIRPVRRK